MHAVVTVQLRLPAVFKEEGGYTVACFPNLDIVTQGRDRQEAERNLIEATQVFLESCFVRGVLDDVLKASGFKPTTHLPVEDIPGQDHLVVPFELLAARNGASSARPC